MAKISLKHERLSPNESVALVQDTENKKKIWRHRYHIRRGKVPRQMTDDYSFRKFKTIQAFRKFVEGLQIKGRVILD